MDPFTIISGVAGIATASSALASTLFDIISTIRDAPREMTDIARGIRELSAILRELRSVFKKGRRLFKVRLFKSIGSVTRQIERVHEEIKDLLKHNGRTMARVQWAFRKSKATRLLAKIESHKVTVGLIATTMLLAVKERRSHSEDTGAQDLLETERKQIRQEAETLVQAVQEAWRNLLLRTEEILQEDKQLQIGSGTEPPQPDNGTDTPRPDSDTDTPPPDSGTMTTRRQTPEEDMDRRNQQLGMWDQFGEDTARWLYRLIFEESQLGIYDPATPSTSSSPAIIRINPAVKSRILDALLHAWTDLTDEEIEHSKSGIAQYYRARVGERARLREGRAGAPAPAATRQQQLLLGEDERLEEQRRQQKEEQRQQRKEEERRLQKKEERRLQKEEERRQKKREEREQRKQEERQQREEEERKRQEDALRKRQEDERQRVQQRQEELQRQSQQQREQWQIQQQMQRERKKQEKLQKEYAEYLRRQHNYDAYKQYMQKQQQWQQNTPSRQHRSLPYHVRVALDWNQLEGQQKHQPNEQGREEDEEKQQNQEEDGHKKAGQGQGEMQGEEQEPYHVQEEQEEQGGQDGQDGQDGQEGQEGYEGQDVREGQEE
ncbi:hypothetical protein QBC39DRAFT_182227 [Podospora conica]|nr:hypothetical protein QBC39DRAFT_182227 [Schizothecium conicum]